MRVSRNVLVARWPLDKVLSVKIGVIVVVGAALIVTAMDYRLYSLPDRMRVLPFYWVNNPTQAKDATVYVMVRNCGRYARQTGHWWWKRTPVDYRACAEDDSTAGEVKAIGELPAASDSPPRRVRFTFACVSCAPGKLLRSVTIPLGASAENGALTLKLPPNLRVNQDDELQLLYTPRTDTDTALTIGVPYVE